MLTVKAAAPKVKMLMRDIDRSLLRESLKLTPEQRLAKFGKFMRFVTQLRSRAHRRRSDEETKP